jgi:hypothetical protein
MQWRFAPLETFVQVGPRRVNARSYADLVARGNLSGAKKPDDRETFGLLVEPFKRASRKSLPGNGLTLSEF